MSFVGEAALSAFFDCIFQKLGSLLGFFKLHRQHQVATEINNWETMLRTLQAVLDDAEQKQLTSQAVKKWLEDLQFLAYDVEDVLDDFNYEMLSRQVKAKNQSCTSVIGNLAPDFIAGYIPNALCFNCTKASNLEKITTRLQEITDRKSQLDLLENVGVGTTQKGWSRPPSSSVPKEPVIFGRDEEKLRIIEFLLRHEHGAARVGVIPIVGMGGLGKTTLARHVYNDHAVKGSFQVRAWVCVSQDYDVTRITRDILEAITSHPCEFAGLSLMQSKLHEALQGKRFLLVVDDLWNENYGDWDVLRSPLMHGAPGSKIIVTTRLAEVANMIKTVKYEALRHMSDDECWSIFCSHAFDWNGNSATNSRFEEIGREIVKKCSGLPLAAMTLGGLLRSKEREEDWEAILKSKSWTFKDGKVDIFSVLRMSYYDLPSHLKRCFAYCAMFPEDFEFGEDALVFLWMAEGLIPQKKMEEDDKHMEDIGHECFHDLVSRSMILPSNPNAFTRSNDDMTWSKDRYVLHDLIHDMAKEVAGMTCYRMEKDRKPPMQAIQESAQCSIFEGARIKEFELLKKMKVFRSVVLPFPLDKRASHTSRISENAIIALVSKLTYIRVLSLNNYSITKLPESIGKLKHLRYLDLSFTQIRSLPKSTTLLYNLQILLLKGCFYLKKLPRDIENLINLWHLDITYTRLDELPPGIKKLRNLGRLSKFIIGKGRGSSITSFRDFKLLRGTLCISKLENIILAKDASSATLSDKKNVEVLELEWSRERHEDTVDEGVLEELQPHKNLKKLSILLYKGASFPSWMVGFSLLQEIEITECPRLSGSLPLLMPSLKKLVVVYCPLLMVSIPHLSTLSELRICSCQGVDCTQEVDFGLLNKLNLSNIANMTSLFKYKVLEGIKHAKSIILSANRPPRSCFASDSSLWEFWNLSEVTSLIMDETEEQVQQALAHMKVEYLNFFDFQSLQKLPQWVCNALSLVILNVCGCPSLTTLLPTGSLPPLLQSLHINSCGELKCISRGGELPIELQLQVGNCSNLEVITQRSNNDMMSLQSLEIINCPNFSELPGGLHNLTSLQSLRVIHCQGLDSIPREGLPTSLKYFEISKTNILKSLIEWGFHNFTSLRRLKMSDCQGLNSIPEEGLPTSLNELVILDTNIFKLVVEWGLHRLPNLTSLDIVGISEVITFPPEDTGMGLSRSLTSLLIWDLPKLKYISTRGFQRLGSLEYLKIEDCPKLANLLGDGLPPSLQKLAIRNCPLLIRSCHFYLKVSRVPRVKVNGFYVNHPDYASGCIPLLKRIIVGPGLLKY